MEQHSNRQGPAGEAKDLVRAFYESYAQRDLPRSFERYIHPDAVMHVPGFDRGSWLEFDSGLVAAFDDLAITVFDQVAEGDKVATRWLLGGHHTGRLLDLPPSGRYASFTATTVDRVEDGKIIEHWADADFTAFLQSLAAPQP
ncbi:ester cyclase [Kitasatospora sp. NPDC058063]|uniref:ester cyclase n=1 Tax=unclassified Kitasatospora TaxID=2633591 RepID=UPI0036D8013D